MLLGGACVLLSSLFFFVLPVVTRIRFGIEAFPTTPLFECIHALQNTVLAISCTWVFQRIGGCAGLRRPWLLVLVLFVVGMGGDLLLHWGETVASHAVITRGRAAVFPSALLKTLPMVAPYTPVLLWLVAGGMAVWAGRRQKLADAPDAYGLVLAAQTLAVVGGILAMMILLQFLMIAVAPTGYGLMVEDMTWGHFLAPVGLALVVGCLVMAYWPERLRHAGAFDLFALGVLMGLLPGILCVLLLQLAQIFGGEALFRRLPAIMLGVYVLGVPLLARGAAYLGRSRPVLPDEAEVPSPAADGFLVCPENKEGQAELPAP